MEGINGKGNKLGSEELIGIAFFVPGVNRSLPIMAQFRLASLASYLETNASTVWSKWTPYLLLIPLASYGIFRVYETEMTNLIIPLFPEEPDKSFGFYRDFLRLCFNELLWLSLFLLTTWIIFSNRLMARIPCKLETRFLRTSSLSTAVVVALVFTLSVLTAIRTLQEFPNSADEYVYLYQAQTISEGKLYQKAHPLVDFFHFNHIAQKEGISVGRFPPGWPLLLSLSFRFDLPPYWVNPLIGAVTLLLFFRFALAYYGHQVAMLSTLVMALTGYFVFNAASYFSHMACMFFAVAFVYCLNLSQEKRGAVYPLMAGAFLGSIVIIRYYTAALFLAPVVICLVCSLGRASFRILFLTGLGTLPFVIFLGWYNLQITGDASLPVTIWADETEALGFVKGHTFVRGLEYTVRRILLFLYWCSPAILVLYFVYLARKVADKTLRFVHPQDYFLFMLLVGYLFYHHLGGNQYGPRFLLEALPFATLFVVNRTLQTKAPVSMAMLVAGVIYCVVKFPYIMEREHQVVEERTDLYEKTKQAGFTNAVVLISTHTGIIRPMPPRDLTRNHMTEKPDVIFAEDLGAKNRLLMEYYPDRTFYRYVRDREKVEGWFEKIPPGSQQLAGDK